MIGDDLGYFELSDVPEGELRFLTRSYPHFRITGITLPPGAAINMTLVLDWGYESLSGQVTDSNGNALGGAKVSLTWSHRYDGLHSTSSRSKITDDSGVFRFSELGPGIHMLTVGVTGYKQAKQEYNAGMDRQDVVVRLVRQ